MLRLFSKTNFSLIQPIKFFMAKPAKQGDGSRQGSSTKGGKPASTPEPVVVQDKFSVLQYLKPLQPSLSSQEYNQLKNGFNDLTKQQKQILDDLGSLIIKLKTPTFYKLLEEEGLGTSQCLYVAEGKMDDSQIIKSIKELRKM